MTFFTLVLSLFLIMDPIGNVPIFAAILQPYPIEKQRKIILREMLIALVALVGFQFLGGILISWIHISIPSIKVAGGIILFMIALGMVFPSFNTAGISDHYEGEPFIVPLSVPLVAGPTILAAIMAYAPQVGNNFIMLSAIVVTWTASTIILLFTPVFLRILKEKAMTAITRLMGLILTFIAIEMLLEGLQCFFQ